MKAELHCAGNNNQDGPGYKFANFTPSEIEQHLAPVRHHTRAQSQTSVGNGSQAQLHGTTTGK